MLPGLATNTHYTTPRNQIYHYQRQPAKSPSGATSPNQRSEICPGNFKQHTGITLKIKLKTHFTTTNPCFTKVMLSKKRKYLS